MRIEVQVPVDENPDPNSFDGLMNEAAQKYGYVVQKRSGMPVDYTCTIVEPYDGTRPYYAISALLYKLKEGETS